MLLLFGAKLNEHCLYYKLKLIVVPRTYIRTYSIVRILKTKHYISEANCFLPQVKPLILILVNVVDVIHVHPSSKIDMSELN
jgi:hypothetical protein